MKIYSAFKFVHEEQDIVVKSDRTLDLSKATVKVSLFDLNAIEAACELKSQVADTEVVALSVGGQLLANPKARKDVLSRGPDSLLLVQDDAFAHLRPNEVAKVLAATLKSKGFDLVLCGNGSGDIYAQQTGLLLGQYLQVPTINGVSKIISCENGKLTVERSLEDEVETLEITLPAVVCPLTLTNRRFLRCVPFWRPLRSRLKFLMLKLLVLISAPKRSRSIRF